MRSPGAHRVRLLLLPSAVVAAILVLAVPSGAQQPYPPQPYPVYPPQYPPGGYPYPQVPPPNGVPTQPGTPLAPYRVPVIMLAAPTEGAALPDDKPVAVLRFMSGEPADPIDALSFSVTVDGTNRTSLFQLTQGEAWGMLAEPNDALSAGQHEISARICTSHGACGVTKATVTIVSNASTLSLAAAKATEKGKQKKTKILDAVLQAARVLIR